MEEEVKAGPSNGGGNDSERGLSGRNNTTSKGPYLGYGLLPENLRHIVGRYISNDKRDPTRCAFGGEQSFALCLSQHAQLELGSCWHFGCLSRGDRWKSSMEVRINKEFLIKDHKSCLDFLDSKNSALFPIVIKVLVFRLDLSSEDFLDALDDLKNTLTLLEKHLRSVRRVVFAIEKQTFCCFSFKDITDNATGRHQVAVPQLALTRILVDLRIGWEINQKLNIRLLLNYYILNDDKPESEIYLSKFVISLSHICDLDLLDVLDATMISRKLIWLHNLETLDDLKHISFKTSRYCHAVHLDASNNVDMPRRLKNLEHSFSLEANPLIERIIVKSKEFGIPLKLPRPSAALTDTSLRSALIELTLMGYNNTFDLTQLNTGYFPHLTHLTVIGGNISGYLDSVSVPHLKTLILEPNRPFQQSRSKMDTLIRKHAQSLMSTDFPWQVVVTDQLGGWSLASYDQPTPNPQHEEKDDSFHSSHHPLPLIKELLLVAFCNENVDEWQSQLNGDRLWEAPARDGSHRRLIWAPERVEKITAFAAKERTVRLDFSQAIPEQTRILTFLTCHNISLRIDGDALPYLKSLKLNCGSVKPRGSFPHLETLSFEEAHIKSLWQVSAPLLRSFHCHQLITGMYLSLHLQLLPHLSYLLIELWRGDLKHCPSIRVDENSLGLSRVNHVVFGEKIAKTPVFNHCQVQHVLHLELAVDALQLPKCWSSTAWHCETLTIHFYAHNNNRFSAQRIPVAEVLPQLPRVKTLTVTGHRCQVLLNTKLHVLTDLTVLSPSSFGPNLKCPKLRCIRFTDRLSESDKEKCLNRATYEAIGAQPKLVYFDFHGEVKRMSWNIAPNESDMLICD